MKPNIRTLLATEATTENYIAGMYNISSLGHSYLISLRPLTEKGAHDIHSFSLHFDEDVDNEMNLAIMPKEVSAPFGGARNISLITEDDLSQYSPKRLEEFKRKIEERIAINTHIQEKYSSGNYEPLDISMTVANHANSAETIISNKSIIDVEELELILEETWNTEKLKAFIKSTALEFTGAQQYITDVSELIRHGFAELFQLKLYDKLPFPFRDGIENFIEQYDELVPKLYLNTLASNKRRLITAVRNFAIVNELDDKIYWPDLV